MGLFNRVCYQRKTCASNSDCGVALEGACVCQDNLCHVCCQEITSACEACKSGLTEAEFCEIPMNRNVQGCETSDAWSTSFNFILIAFMTVGIMTVLLSALPA